jgi:arylsulfatase A-like enzyme
MNIILIVFDTLRKDCVGAYRDPPPWGDVNVPHFQKFAQESLVMERAYPNVLPTLPARVALYSGKQVYPYEQGDIRLKGDFVGSPGWGPIPEEWPTLAEMLHENGYRTSLIADLFHMFKPSKNFWRGFDQWTFLRGQETDPARSGPRLSQAEIDFWLPDELRSILKYQGNGEDILVEFIQQCIMNFSGRTQEADYFAPRIFQEAALWLEQNQDAEDFFLLVESFDPHEPWLIPSHYRRMYREVEDQEQVISYYHELEDSSPGLLERSRANYRGAVSLCDRWFGHFYETLRVLGRLEDTMVILTADHGHSLGEDDYMGKRGYPSRPEVYDLPLLVRFPGAEHAGTRSSAFVQHVDLAASILESAGVQPAHELDGRDFIPAALSGEPGWRDHATVGWGSTPTVITDRWWFNCKVDGTGIFLHDLGAPDPFSENLADQQRTVVEELFSTALVDAGGRFPDWLIDLAATEADAPGCSKLAARV